MKSTKVSTMEWAGEIGLRIREAREGRGLSQADLGDLLLVHRNTVENWENGGTQPLRQLAGLADALDVNFRWLLYGDEEVALQQRLESIDTQLARLDAQVQEILRKWDVVMEHRAEQEIGDEKAPLSQREKRESAKTSNGTHRKGRT